MSNIALIDLKFVCERKENELLIGVNLIILKSYSQIKQASLKRRKKKRQLPVLISKKKVSKFSLGTMTF